MDENYSQAHKPRRLFASRSEYLLHELEISRFRRWVPHWPLKDYRFEWEDAVPALAGTIGKVVMVAAVVAAWAAQLNLSPDFVIENTRFEMLIAGLLFVILFSGFLNPNANLAGTHGPMIPLIPLIVAAGGHPLALAVMVGMFGLVLSFSKGGSRLITLTGDGVRGGLLLYLGAVGTIGQISAFKTWSAESGVPYLAFILIFIVVLVYALLARWHKRWLAIPLCSAIALVVSWLLDTPFAFKTEPGIPNLNPAYWWGEQTGWMIGMPGLEAILASLPFALLAVAMWPPDFLGHRVFQELNYPKKSQALMNVDDTMTVVSIRQMVGGLLGGGNLSSSWGTYLIPAAIAKRPIPAGAILTGLFCIIFAIAGYPMDLAAWKPVLVVALLVGVFLPLLEAGMQMVKDSQSANSAGVCIFASALVNPVFGWALATLLDNLGLIGDRDRPHQLSLADRLLIPLATFLVCTGIMAAVGMLPGVPALLSH